MVMIRQVAMGVVGAVACGAFGAVPAEVTVFPAKAVGPIKILNATNNGPMKGRSDQTRGNFEEYKMLGVPFARVHDTRVYDYYGAHHCADISGMFPDFDKDVTKESSYDFTCADEYLKVFAEIGTEPFFQFGETIEHWIKKFMVKPPKDFRKWAQICEHVIMHYNEGWNNGFHMNIKYWEIWNEPDCKPTDDGRGGATWDGTEAQFYDLFSVTAKHLKKRFPNLKVGGPAIIGDCEWADRFLAEMHRREVPIDFFSWHCYCETPSLYAKRAGQVRAVLEKNGYGKAESILNEWNYVKGWSDEWTYSLRAESGDLRAKGAAFVAASMTVQQHTDISLGMYYDARPTLMNGLFDGFTLDPAQTYYVLQSWSRLLRLGTEVASAVSDEKKTKCPEVYAAAAKDKDGRLGVLVARYCRSDDEVETRWVTLRVKGGTLDGARVYFTDHARAFTEMPYPVNADGTIRIKMTPNSFAYIER